ncbi:MAG: tRNA pseudouridine(38-40) synthase TruA [Myxococcota bacterium]
MPRFRFTLEYDGARFAGWQRQGQGERTVQEELERALAELAGGRRVEAMGSGRTDAGVHALAQVASAWLDTALDPATLQRALNAKLPADVAVLAVEQVADDFDARRDALAKLYRYAIWNAPQRSPLRAARAHWVPTGADGRGLDVEAMREAAAQLVGERDFAAFCAAGSSVATTVRRLLRLDVVARARPEGREIEIEAEGAGFLRHMVRNLAGTLVEVGQGRRAAGSMPALLASRDRGAAGPTAPACGLALVAVRYARAGAADSAVESDG